jgi:hypothetical protein
MTDAAEDPAKKLADAALRLAHIFAGKRGNNKGSPDRQTSISFADALFECPFDALDDVPAILEKRCSPEEMREIIRVIDDIHRALGVQPDAASATHDEET